MRTLKIISNLMLFSGFLLPVLVISYLNLLKQNNPTLAGQMTASAYIFMLSFSCMVIFILSFSLKIFYLVKDVGNRNYIEYILLFINVLPLTVSLNILLDYFVF